LSPSESAHCHSQEHDHCHGSEKHRFDFLYWGSLIFVAFAYGFHLAKVRIPYWKWDHFNHQIFEVMNTMWWGVALGILAIGALNLIPREMVMTYFVGKTRLGAIFKATLAGTLFDLCNHGILILGMKIYERGATLGQTMAFLIASPWNSFSLTMIMYALIGGELTFIFLILSLVVAIISGLLFDQLVQMKILPENPNSNVVVDHSKLRIQVKWTWAFWFKTIWDGAKESKMIIKWILFGAILSAIVSCFMSPEMFIEYFGKSFRGLLTTLLAATGIEICSEGSLPLAADLVNVAHAPGNAFIFLMAGVATDFTEILLIRHTMKSWKVALALPLVTVPQIVLLGVLLNWDLFSF
jgi:uncharacterized protein